MAQDRVAEAAHLLLADAPVAELGLEGNQASGEIGLAPVPDVTSTEEADIGRDFGAATLELRRGGWVHEVEAVDEGESHIEELGNRRVNAVVGQDPPAGESVNKPEPMTIEVVDPPEVGRIPGIGRTYERSLTHADIFYVTELARSSSHALEVFTDASRSETQRWWETANGYTDVYSLTWYAEIGPDQAEAFYHAEEYTEVGGLRSAEDLLRVKPDDLGEPAFIDGLERTEFDRMEALDIEWGELWDSLPQES